MIRRILIGFGVATVVILFLLWLVTGGVQKTINTAKRIGNPIDYIFFNGTSTTGYFRLPWQPEELAQGPSIPDISVSSSDEKPQTTEEELTQTQKEYDALVSDTEAARTFGDPSPERGKVSINAGGASEPGVTKEYLEIEASWENTAPIKVTGWSVQSALTGVRAYIPRGANLFWLGSVNDQTDMYLAPGATAILATAPSPVGTSFRENICSGYLGRLQTFVPSLSPNCPLASESLPLTPDNLKQYGDACFDFVQQLPVCTLPREAPSEISPICRIFLANTISYNGCVEEYQHRSNFLRSAWRIYLNAGGELWRNTHDIIRLLDREGRTVDVLSY